MLDTPADVPSRPQHTATDVVDGMSTRSAPASTSPASRYAHALLGAFVRLGVRHLVVSPGSRSQALALAAAALDGEDAHLHVRLDERVAGFFALGVGVETGMPAVAITTSGTAGAQLHAAMLEAHHAHVPLIAITADRPAELQGVRANQTMTQTGLYGTIVRLEQHVNAPTGSDDEPSDAAALARAALAAACGATTGTPGPVHLNIAFRAPLSGPVPDDPGSARPESAGPEPAAPEPAGDRPPAGTPDGIAGSAPVAVRPPERVADQPVAPQPASFRSSIVAGRAPLALRLGPRTIVIAGHGSGPDAEQLAHEAGWPLIAEVVSGAHYGRELIVSYRELLRQPALGGRVQRAIVFGHPTLSREIPALLARDDVEVVVVAPHGVDVVNPGRRAVSAVSAVHLEDSGSVDPDREWLRSWVVTSRHLRAASDDMARQAPDVERSRSLDPHERAAFARAELAAVRAPVTRRMLVETVWQFTWPYDRLVFGASQLIRDADAVVPGKKIAVHANRGLSGIDGTIATAMGLAAAASDGSQPHTGITRVLLGDLAFLHDAGALLFGAAERRPVMQVIVGNDHGGSIFDRLEVARTAPADDFDRVLRTPQDADLEGFAKAYRWEYTSAATYGELERALSGQGTVPRLIEVPLAR
jgi:2-succinyl-5-enolpyruvyl-6-hydroxy-3-cyclohexene-1-carboxylate synthase